MKTVILNRGDGVVEIAIIESSISTPLCKNFEDILLSLKDDFDKIVLNMSSVSKVAPEFFLALVRAVRDSEISIVLAEVKKHIREIFEISNLYKTFPILPSMPKQRAVTASEVSYGSAS